MTPDYPLGQQKGVIITLILPVLIAGNPRWETDKILPFDMATGKQVNTTSQWYYFFSFDLLKARPPLPKSELADSNCVSDCQRQITSQCFHVFLFCYEIVYNKCSRKKKSYFFYEDLSQLALSYFMSLRMCLKKKINRTCDKLIVSSINYSSTVGGVFYILNITLFPSLHDHWGVTHNFFLPHKTMVGHNSTIMMRENMIMKPVFYACGRCCFHLRSPSMW